MAFSFLCAFIRSEAPKRFTFFISDSQMPCGSSTRSGTISAFLRPDVTEFDTESTTD